MPTHLNRQTSLHIERGELVFEVTQVEDAQFSAYPREISPSLICRPAQPKEGYADSSRGRDAVRPFEA